MIKRRSIHRHSVVPYLKSNVVGIIFCAVLGIGFAGSTAILVVMATFRLVGSVLIITYAVRHTQPVSPISTEDQLSGGKSRIFKDVFSRQNEGMSYGLIDELRAVIERHHSKRASRHGRPRKDHRKSL